jgi:translation elongation factor EF-Tu-like GTPase
MIVESIFSMSSRGAVLAGYLKEGELKVGQDILLRSRDHHIKSKIEGIEIDRKSLLTAKEGQHLAILLYDLDLTLVSDGFTYAEGVYTPKSLRVVEVPDGKVQKRGWFSRIVTRLLSHQLNT